MVINPIADGVGVIGGGSLVAFFLFGVDGPASLLLVEGSVVSKLVIFRFLLILANFGEPLPFVVGSPRVTATAAEAALNLVDLLVDMLNDVDLKN